MEQGSRRGQEQTTLPESLRKIPFSPGEFERRLRGIREATAARELDALLVTVPENLYYLTGYQVLGLGYFVTPHFLIVPADTEPCFVVRYADRVNVWARSWLQRVELFRDTEDPVALVRGVLQRVKAKRIGIEKDSWPLSVALYERLAAAIAPATFHDSSGLVEQLRVIKSPEELRYVEAAAAISDTTMQAAIEAVGEGQSDVHVAAAAHHACVLAGSEFDSDTPAVIVGPQTLLFHHTWCGQPIRRGDVVFLDFTGTVGRYIAPVARTAVLGRPAQSVLDRYRVIEASLEAGLAAMRPGMTCAELFQAFAQPVGKAGYEMHIKAGYAVGAGFPPRRVEYDGLNLLPTNHTVLEPGMVIHTPRTIRVPGEQTPILGETSVITGTGRRVLSRLSRELFVR